jgi:hypothetical protein
LKIPALFTFVLIFLILSQPALAYDWDNDIIVRSDSMSWTYTETYSGNHSVLFKVLIDSELGNDDGFVSAWELLKVDVKSRKTFFNSISKDLDVGVDNSSDFVHITSVESSFSSELVGPVSLSKNIVNVYEVNYLFADILPSNGSIWFRGEPGSNVTISFSEEFIANSTNGIDNLSTNLTNTSTLVGVFGADGIISVQFEEIISFVEAEKPPLENNTSETVISEQETPSLMDDIFPGFTDGLARKLKSSSDI